jgi:ABC-type uncharacterized transport system permease subunit
MNISPLLHEQIQAEFGEYNVDNVVGTTQMFFRFGYWQRVDVNKLQSILGDTISVIEDNLDDDDCGTLFSYKLK